MNTIPYLLVPSPSAPPGYCWASPVAGAPWPWRLRLNGILIVHKTPPPGTPAPAIIAGVRLPGWVILRQKKTPRALTLGASGRRSQLTDALAISEVTRQPLSVVDPEGLNPARLQIF